MRGVVCVGMGNAGRVEVQEVEGRDKSASLAERSEESVPV